MGGGLSVEGEVWGEGLVWRVRCVGGGLSVKGEVWG